MIKKKKRKIPVSKNHTQLRNQSKNAKEEKKRKDLVNGRANELAAENDVTEQDSEVAAGLWVLGLLVEDEPCYGHQVRTMSICRVIHVCLCLRFKRNFPEHQKVKKQRSKTGPKK